MPMNTNSTLLTALLLEPLAGLHADETILIGKWAVPLFLP